VISLRLQIHKIKDIAWVFNLYAEPDFYNPGKLKEVADIVLTKESKVHSTAIKEMRSKVREILEKANME
jgi:signal recognition particle subunit SEC65